MKNKTITAEVLETKMTMRVRLETGEVIQLAGSAPAGSTIEIHATGLSRKGLLMGYEGYVPTYTPKPTPSFAAAAEAAGFSEVKVLT